MSFRTPLEVAVGGYMGGFYASLTPDTDQMREYVARGLAKSIVWAPGRMIDKVEEMIKSYRQNENDPGPGLSSRLPVVIVAMSKDFMPAPADWGLPVGSMVDVAFPDDELGRAYKVVTSTNEYRLQIVFLAPEPHTAHSLAMQFNLWANGSGGRRFKHRHEFAGSVHEFPAVLETLDIGAVNTETEEKVLTILVADINVRATIPIFKAPKDDQPNDGKAAPAGYPVVVVVNTSNPRGESGSTTSLDADGNIVMEQH